MARRAILDFTPSVSPMPARTPNTSECFGNIVYFNVEEETTNALLEFEVWVMSPLWIDREWEALAERGSVDYIFSGVRNGTSDDGARMWSDLISQPGIWLQRTWNLDQVLGRIDLICAANSPASNVDILFARLQRSMRYILNYHADARENRRARIHAPGR